MRKIFTILILLIFISCEKHISSNEFVQLGIKNLKCEYAANPINIDISNPRFSWVLSSKIRGQKQTAYQIFVSKNKDLSDLIWDSGKINNSLSNQIYYAGKNLESNTNYYWKVHVWDKDDILYESKITGFGTALLKQNNWVAKWIGVGQKSQPSLPNGFLKSVEEQSTLTDTIIHEGRSLLLRNKFECKKNIKSAKVFVTGLGYYELYLNGNRVGDHVLSPAKTNYAKEILYDTYDVTTQLKKGENTFGIHLGNGWYNPYKKWWKEYRMQWFGAKKAILQLQITYQNGETTVIKSDKNWKFKLGPILYNCIYDGEFYDATQESENWSKPDFDDSNWDMVSVIESPKGELRSQNMQAIKLVQIIEPVKVFKPKSGALVYDMGQNFSGWAKITVNGKKGTKLHLQFAEDINEDGSIDITSNEHAKAEATYILKGNSSETYEPRFTFYGFKYVEVTSNSDLLEIENVQGCVVHSNNELTGHFECGNETINKIHKATVWSQKSNMIGFPLDCPQRDERLGWFGDAQVTIEEAMFNFNMPLFYHNWITGIRKNQDSLTGDIPIISPR
ncbi:MAG: alpha-L-rhamnosidase, partial [Bacteroidetes bacterium]